VLFVLPHGENTQKAILFFFAKLLLYICFVLLSNCAVCKYGLRLAYNNVKTKENDDVRTYKISNTLRFKNMIIKNLKIKIFNSANIILLNPNF